MEGGACRGVKGFPLTVVTSRSVLVETDAIRVAAGSCTALRVTVDDSSGLQANTRGFEEATR